MANWFSRIFGGRSHSRSFGKMKTPNFVRFDEDDYCQQEILPLAALEFCRKEIDEINRFARAHLAPEGCGWTDVHVRKDSPFKLVELGITREILRDIMGGRLPEVLHVHVGNPSHSELCPNTVGYGYDSACIVYAEWNTEGIIDPIWVSNVEYDKGRQDCLVNSLQRLGECYALLYVDWVHGFTAPLDGSEALHIYLANKRDSFKQE